jgi:mono/diheme cytochrome c family protein
MARSAIIVGALAALIIGGAGAVFVIAWRPAIAAVEPPSPRSFAPDLVRRGRELAAIGNCNDCHTASGGRNFAGGLPVPTPFGAVFSSNITPDVETGIGSWSEAAFRRAMLAGVDREGRHLYPTFPYDHFTNVSDDDNHALYAFLMTRETVRAPARDNRLFFPLNQRVMIAGWKLLFFHRGTFQQNPAKSAEWNRGAYLVEGLAHCGSCHTPRNLLGAERSNASFAGGQADNWKAYALNAQSSSPVPWDAEALYAYLHKGWHPDHGTARGPMAEVVRNLSQVSPSDVHAIATYMADMFGRPGPERSRQGEQALAQAKAGPTTVSGGAADSRMDSPGAAIYASACATCHETGRAPPYGGINLRLSTAISDPDPRNLANIVLSGVAPVAGERSPIMPAFASSMNDAQIASLLNYLRSRFGSRPAWTGIEKTVKDARATETASLQPSTGGAGRAPATDSAERAKP